MKVWLDEFSRAEYTSDHYPDQETDHHQHLWGRFPLLNHDREAGYKESVPAYFTHLSYISYLL